MAHRDGGSKAIFFQKIDLTIGEKFKILENLRAQIKIFLISVYKVR